VVTLAWLLVFEFAFVAPLVLDMDFYWWYVLAVLGVLAVFMVFVLRLVWKRRRYWM